MLSLDLDKQQELLANLGSSAENRKILFEAAAELLASSMDEQSEENMKAALLFNQQAWNAFQSSILEESLRLSMDAKRNLLALGAFVEHRTNELLVKPDPERARPLQKAALCLACDSLDK